MYVVLVLIRLLVLRRAVSSGFFLLLRLFFEFCFGCTLPRPPHNDIHRLLSRYRFDEPLLHSCPPTGPSNRPRREKRPQRKRFTEGRVSRKNLARRNLTDMRKVSSMGVWCRWYRAPILCVCAYALAIGRNKMGTKT